MKKFTALLMLILLAAIDIAAQPLYTLKQGDVGNYSIDKKPDITNYEWRVFTDAQLTTPAEAGSVKLTATPGNENEIKVAWQMPGFYYLTVYASGSNGCSNTMAFPFEIEPETDFLAIDDYVVLYNGYEVPVDVFSNDIDRLGVRDTASLLTLTDPENGNSIPTGDGTFTYIPNPGFFGPDSFEYRVCTHTEPTDCATAWVYVDVRENRPPVANDLYVDATFETDSVYRLWNNIYDPEGMLDSTSLAIGDSANLGILQVLAETGEVVYSPFNCTVGTDTFSYLIYDTFGLASDTAQVYITLGIDSTRDSDFDGVADYIEDLDGDGNPCNDDTDGNELPNYRDVDDDGDGILTIHEDIDGDGDPTNDDTDGDGIPNYLDNDDDDDCMATADEIEFGGIGFDLDEDGMPNYLDDDDNGDGIPSCDQMQDLDNNGVLDRDEIWNSLAIDDYVTVGMNEISDMNVLANDSSRMLPATIQLIEYPYNGTVTINSDYSLNYTPDNEYEGEDSLFYAVCDYYQICDTALVFINVKDLISPPQLFTPNNDGDNDQYTIHGLERYPDNHFVVYNRWGNKVFEQEGYYDEWDGYSNINTSVGKRKLAVGVYYYILKYGDKEKAGALFLER